MKSTYENIMYKIQRNKYCKVFDSTRQIYKYIYVSL